VKIEPQSSETSGEDDPEVSCLSDFVKNMKLVDSQIPSKNVNCRFALFQKETDKGEILGFAPVNAVSVYDKNDEAQWKKVEAKFAELKQEAKKLNVYYEEVDLTGLSVQSVGLIGGISNRMKHIKFPPPKSNKWIVPLKKLKSPPVSDSETRRGNTGDGDGGLSLGLASSCAPPACARREGDSSDEDESSDEL